MPRPMKGPIEKSKDFKGSMKELIASLNNWRYMILFCIILAMISAIISLIAPNKLSNLTDTITLGITPNVSKETIQDIMNDKSISYEEKLELSNLIKDASKEEDKSKLITKMDNLPKSIITKIKPKIDMNKVKSIFILLVILYVVSSLFSYIESILLTITSNRYAKKLRTDIQKKIHKLPLKYFDTNETGDVLSRITNDVDTIAQNLNHSLATLVTSTTLFIGSIIMMFVTNYIMAMTAIISSLIGFGFMAKILSKSQKYFTMRQEQLGDLNGYIEEIYSAHNVVKAYNGEIEASQKFDSLNKKLYDSNRKSQFLSGIMQPMMMFVGNFGYVAVCIVGAILTMNNTISFGVIVAFMIYVRMFTNPLSQIAQSMTALQSTAAASERVFEFIKEEEMTDESSLKKKLDKESVKGKIEFKNVKFGYNKDKTIIKNFNVDIKPGQKIAIVGPTGAGKTTLVNLLMKFYEIDSGDITIDGVSINSLTRENVHDLFVMVLQDTWTFDGTVKDNIKFNKEDVKEEDIMKACKVVGVDHFVKTLPGGINSQLSDNDEISSGQKQLLTIARGMIENAPFLILDEATSNVDTRTEELVAKAMDKLTKGKTSFIIAHRLSTIKNADLILVMNEGDIIEQGTHNELLNKNGFYADLYNSQFESIIN